MSTTTTNLHLTKPAGNELIDLDVINGNIDILDEKIGAVGNTSLQEQISTLSLLIYPVGSIYMSVNSTSPATLFGGTWERIQGKFLLSATDDGSSGASQAAGNTGGEATHTLTTSEMPSHGHTFTGTQATTNANNRGHTHGMKSHTHGYDHPNGSTNGTSISTDQLANHRHEQYVTANDGSSGARIDYNQDRSSSIYYQCLSGSSGSGSSHSHGIGTWWTSTGGPSDNTSNGESQNHTHTFTATGTVGSSGSDGAHNNMPPYLSVYMWKRTA